MLTDATCGIGTFTQSVRCECAVSPPPTLTVGTNFPEHPLLVDPEDDDVLNIALMPSADVAETCNPIWGRTRQAVKCAVERAPSVLILSQLCQEEGGRGSSIPCLVLREPSERQRELEGGGRAAAGAA